jgi:succinoglycan biosynthesis transport protein ExoP
MKDEFDQSKKELDVIEDKLTAFRMKNNGKLPDQVQGNMQQVTALQSQVYALNANLSRAEQDKLQIEATLRILKDQQVEINKQSTEAPTVASAQRNEQLVDAEKEVQYWEDNLRVLRQKYSENYPDVQTAIGRLAAAKAKRDDLQKQDVSKKAEAKADPAPKILNQTVVHEQRDLDGRIRQLQSSAEAKDLEIQEANKELKRATEAIKSYESRLETVPLGEKEYGDLLRDRDIAKQKYVDLDERLTKAERAESMEQRKQGELLEMLDPASLPTTPAEPKRPIVISIGAGFGLLLGIVIAGAREMKDSSLKNLKDVRAYTQLAILGSIPLLENDFVVRRRRRLAWLGWTTACLGAVVIMAGSVVYYYVANSR